MRRIFAIGGAVAIATLGVLVLRSPAFAEAVSSGAEWARDAGAIGVVAFVLAYVIATVFLVPGSVLTIAAGFTYGLGWGMVLVTPTATVAATAAFLVGRGLVRDRMTRRFGEGRRFRAIDAAVDKRGALIVTLLRLSPVVPFVVLNYLLAISKVRTRPYVAASAVGRLPGTVLFVYLGTLASTAAEAASGGSLPSGLRLGFLAAGLVATIAVVVIVARLARRELARTGAT